MKRSKIICCHLLFCLTVYISCSTGVATHHDKTKIFTFSSDTVKLTKSKELIDNTPTYELLFALSENAQCVELSVSAQDRNGRKVRCAYIVESLVDVSRYVKKPAKPIYAELAKNFDINWRFQSTISICNDEIDPLKRLNKGNYRLRISAFSNDFYIFTVGITSPVEILFIQ